MNNLIDTNEGNECSHCGNKEYTDQWLINDIYSNQVRKYGKKNVHYNEHELYEYLMNDDKYDFVYHVWIKSDCFPELTPTCVRINSDKPFSLDNINVVPNTSLFSLLDIIEFNPDVRDYMYKWLEPHIINFLADKIFDINNQRQFMR